MILLKPPNLPSNFGNDRVLKIEQVGKFNNWISKLCQQVELMCVTNCLETF